jgi:hypothetical protein
MDDHQLKLIVTDVENDQRAVNHVVSVMFLGTDVAYRRREEREREIKRETNQPPDGNESPNIMEFQILNQTYVKFEV